MQQPLSQDTEQTPKTIGYPDEHSNFSLLIESMISPSQQMMMSTTTV